MLALPLALSTAIYIYISIYTPTSACLSDLHFPFHKSPSELGHLELTGSKILDTNKGSKGNLPPPKSMETGFNEKTTSRDKMETPKRLFEKVLKLALLHLVKQTWKRVHFFCLCLVDKLGCYMSCNICINLSKKKTLKTNTLMSLFSELSTSQVS